MRVLMLGWDFSPRLTGGVGTACRGLANALARAPDSLRTEILFVLPRVLGDEEPEDVRLLSGADAEHSAHRPARPAEVQERPRALRASSPSVRLASVRAPEPDSIEPEAPLEAEAPTPAMMTPAEALSLLEVDSPLQPYLSGDEYARTVRALMARIRGQGAPRAGAPRSGRGTTRARTPRAVVAAEPPAALPARPPRGATTAPEPAPEPEVPPYGQTLSAEVERYARAVLTLVQGETFDVIHAHDWMTFPAGMLLHERTGKPLIVHFHSSESERRGAQAAPDVRAIEQAGIDAAERVLCVSEQSARTLRANYGIEYAKVRVLHNAYSPLPQGAPRTRRPGPTVLYLGRLSEQKAPDLFLRAAARVHGRNPEARFVLAGRGELYPELQALAEELDIARRVRFTGFVAGEELARTWADADVYVLSSDSEPFGISALEALSLGIPTIVPRDAGVTEVVRSVLRFRAGDADELADKIVALLERPALRRQLASSGLREVRKLRWDRPARALRGIYDEIAPAAR